MPSPLADVDTGEEGLGPRSAQDSWRVGAGITPDDAVEGEAAVQEALDTQAAEQAAESPPLG